jgi:hypothetical protein
MGFLRGALVTVLGVVLLISLFVMNAALTITWSLEYETLKPVLKDVVGDLTQEQFDEVEIYLEEAIEVMQLYCENETEFVFSQEGYTFVIPCEVIFQGSKAVIDYGTDNLIEEIYYKQYDCKYWDCVKKTNDFLVLISEKSHSYWQGKFYIFLLTSIALFVLMFLVSNRKSNAFIFSGVLTIISSLPFIKLIWLANLVPESIRYIFLSFFAKSYNVFIMVFIIGVFLLGLGIAFHFLKWGLKISKLFRKDSGEDEDDEEDLDKEDVKEIVKKELSKNKAKQENKKQASDKQNISKNSSKSVKSKKPEIKSNKK